MKIRRPSPSMVISVIALVMATTGSAVAAVDFARRAGSVDGRSAVSAGSSLKHAAGRLVATREKSPYRGQLPGRFVANVPHSTTFGRAAEVADNAAGGSQVLNVSELGAFATTCNDQANAAGTEDPTTTLTFTSTPAVNFARQVGGNNATVVAMAPGTAQSVTINGSNTFHIQVELSGTNVVYDGQVRQDGRGTPSGTCLVTGTATTFRP
jgi:hypothetical protein